MGTLFSKCPKTNATVQPSATIPPPVPLRILYAFDFDNTILDDDSESAILSAYENVKDEAAPASVVNAFNRLEPIEYAQYIQDYVSLHGVNLVDILRALFEMPLVPGMENLLQKIQSTFKSPPYSHLIILSGSFDYFIRSVLSACDPPIKPSAIVSNHALRSNHVNPESLIFRPYQYQSSCSLCPSCLCKGAALAQYMTEHGPFDQVVFVCDGSNDVCPAIKLRPGDLLFVRKDYGLACLIKQAVAEAGADSAAKTETSAGGTSTTISSTTATTTSTSNKSKAGPSRSSTINPLTKIKANVVYFRTGKYIQQRLGLK